MTRPSAGWAKSQLWADLIWSAARAVWNAVAKPWPIGTTLVVAPGNLAD